MKTLIRTFSLSVILFSLPYKSIACSCIFPYVEHFCRIVDDSKIIVRAEVIDTADILYDNLPDHLRTIIILDNLNQQIPLDTAILLGQDGINCGEWLDQFQKGDTLILALDYINSLGVYSLQGACGLHYLRFSQGKVFDEIDFAYDTLDYDVFVNQLNDCMSLRTSTSEPLSEVTITTFPNPVQDQLTVQIATSRVLEQVELLNINGQVLLFREGNKLSSLQLDTRTLDNGIYYLRVWVKGKMRMEKVMVMR